MRVSLAFGMDWQEFSQIFFHICQCHLLSNTFVESSLPLASVAQIQLDSVKFSCFFRPVYYPDPAQQRLPDTGYVYILLQSD